jgi:hypothetical protein
MIAKCFIALIAGASLSFASHAQDCVEKQWAGTDVGYMYCEDSTAKSTMKECVEMQWAGTDVGYMHCEASTAKGTTKVARTSRASGHKHIASAAGQRDRVAHSGAAHEPTKTRSPVPL